MLGQKCFVGDQCGTIRWIGFLEGLDSERIGVELDQPSPDRHAGEYRGAQIFACRPHCGVFVKASKISFSLEQAIQSRYKPEAAAAKKEQCANLVGYEKIQKQVENLQELSFACLEKSQISTAGNIAALGNLTRLRLSDNLIGNFSVVLDITRQLPHLLELDLTDNKIDFRQISDSRGFPSVDSRLSALVLCRTGAASLAPVLREISVAFPKLALLNLEGNEISDIPADCVWPEQLQTLDLSSNSLRWSEISKLPASLVSLNLDSNPLGDEISDLSLPASLHTLLLHSCEISDWSLIRKISACVGDMLQNFRVTGNAVYGSHVAARHVVVATFPTLRVLNGAEVKPKIRTDAEKYVAHNETLQKLVNPEILARLKAKHPRDPDTVTADERQTRKSQGISVQISGLDKNVQFTTMPALTVNGFRKLVVKRANWPIDLGDTEIRWSPKGDESELGCAYLLETSEADEAIGEIFGQSAEISVFLSVSDKLK